MHTGDLGRIDAEGNIYVIDRLKELIKVKGHQVAPAELEQVLLGNPSVADAAVTSVLVDGDERPVAFVVTNDDRCSPEDLGEWVAERVAPYKRLRAVHTVDAIPRNTNGKNPSPSPEGGGPGVSRPLDEAPSAASGSGDGRHELVMGPRARAAVTDSVVAMVHDFVDGIDRAQVPPVGSGDDMMKRFLAAPPEVGLDDPAALLATVVAAARTGLDTASGGQLSHIPNGSLYSAALARFVAAALNPFTGCGFVQPGAVALEQSVINWMLDLFGFGPPAAGVLVSGGSTANLQAVIAARERMAGERLDDLVVYSSQRAHHSVRKAARLAGIGRTRIRAVTTDSEHRLDPAALERAIARDRARGLRPMMIVATAGSTDTGTIDPLAACAELAAANELWLHVDAAYGGFFALTDRGRDRLRGIERADSITVDGHKGLQIPFGVGGLLVADGDSLRRAHHVSGPYLPDDLGTADVPDFTTLGIELSRPYRGLDVWFPLHLHGVARFRDQLDGALDLADQAAARLSDLDGLEVLAGRDLSVVCLRSVRSDTVTTAILDHLNGSGDLQVSATTIDGRRVIRLAILSMHTTAAIVDRAVDLVAEGLSVTRRCRRTTAPDRPAA